MHTRSKRHHTGLVLAERLEGRTLLSDAYTITDLGGLNSDYTKGASYAFGIDGGGTVTGNATTNSGQEEGFVAPYLYQYLGDGFFTGIGDLGYGSAANGIAGEVTGFVNTTPTGGQAAFIWSENGTAGPPSNPQMQLLGNLPGGVASVGNAINDFGQVAGYSTAIVNSSARDSAVLWPPNGVIQDLGTLPGGDNSRALAINAAAQVTGYSTIAANGPKHAFLWSSAGGMQDLGTLPGYVESEGLGINAGGSIAGYAINGPNVESAFLRTPDGAVQDLGGLPGFPASEALGVNASDEVVGFTESVQNGAISGVGSAFLWTKAAGMRDLNTLLPDSQWTLIKATAINDAGQIVGWGIDAAFPGQARAFFLAPNTHLVFSQLPAATAAGATIAPAVTVSVEGLSISGLESPTLYSERLFDDNSNVTLAIRTGPAGTTLAGTLTVAAQGGLATFSDLSLPVGGTYTLSATDGDYGPGSSVTFYIASQAATVSLSSSNITPNVGDSVLLTAHLAPVASAGATPTGDVTIFSDGSAIGDATLQADGTATFTASFAQGSHAITASYGGDASYIPAQSTSSLTEIVSQPSNLQAADSGRLPSSLVAGAKAHISQKLRLTDPGGTALNGKVKLAWFLSTGTTIDSSAIALPMTSSKTLKIKPHKRRTWTTNLKGIPATVPMGIYHLLLQITDPSGGTTVVPSATTIAVAAPMNELSASFLKTPASAKIGARLAPTLLLTNSGNARAVGVLQFVLDASPDGSLGQSPVRTSKPINIKPGKSMRIRIGGLVLPSTLGSYFLVAEVYQMDPTGSIYDLHLLNGLVVSKKPIVVS